MDWEWSLLDTDSYKYHVVCIPEKQIVTGNIVLNRKLEMLYITIVYVYVYVCV